MLESTPSPGLPRLEELLQPLDEVAVDDGSGLGNRARREWLQAGEWRLLARPRGECFSAGALIERFRTDSGAGLEASRTDHGSVYVPFEFDLLRALEMLTVHDLVEIDAGDTFAYDAAGQITKAERERVAAERIFGLLPADQASRLHELWEEFEVQQTPTARVANAVDRLQPLLQNAYSDGGSWRSHHVTRAQVLQRMAPIESTLPGVWPMVLEIVDSFCGSGLIHPGG